MSARIAKKCMNCGNMVYLTPPINGDKTKTELEHENRNLKLELQTANAELHQLHRKKSMGRALVESFTRTFNQITGNS